MNRTQVTYLLLEIMSQICLERQVIPRLLMQIPGITITFLATSTAVQMSGGEPTNGGGNDLSVAFFVKREKKHLLFMELWYKMYCRLIGAIE
jgi:hypothetical protein